MQISASSQTHYQRLGGAEAVRALVQRFYQLMDTLPQVQTLRQMHQADLSNAEEKLFMFLSGWMGGPQLYIEQFGHPRLRMRHLPFKIDETAREQWMHCMTQALQEQVADDAFRAELQQAFYKVADFMRNQ